MLQVVKDTMENRNHGCKALITINRRAVDEASDVVNTLNL